jgi:hypothetical protein
MVQVYRSGQGFEGVYEYEPIGADDGQVATGLPDACLVSAPNTVLGVMDTPGANPDWWVEQKSCEAAYSATPPAAQANPEHLHLRAVLPHAGTLILRLRTYPAWRIRINGQPAGPLTPREDGLTAVPVPQGPVDLTADWSTTPDVRAGRWLSALVLLLVIALWLRERRSKIASPSRLS